MNKIKITARKKSTILFLIIISVMMITVSGCSKTEKIDVSHVQEPDRFEVHFIDVGQGDAILVICNEHAMLVDGGRSRESDKIYSYLRNHDIQYLDYIVATHPDADHVGGLAGALNYAAVDVALSPVADDETETFQDFKKYLAKQGIEITIPEAGSAYSTGQQWLNAVRPQIAVITCGSDNEYGHPTEQVLNRLKNMGISVLRTDMHGDIIFQEIDGELHYGVAYDTNENVYTPGVIPTPEEEPEQIVKSNAGTDNTGTGNEQTYILNTNTKKFHYPNCKSVKQMKDKNKKEFTGTRDDAIAMGYDPCGNCNP